MPLHIRQIHRRILKFTADEDKFLKHGFGQWTAILRGPDFKFQTGRVADSLKKGLKSTSFPIKKPETIKYHKKLTV